MHYVEEDFLKVFKSFSMRLQMSFSNVEIFKFRYVYNFDELGSSKREDLAETSIRCNFRSKTADCTSDII